MEKESRKPGRPAAPGLTDGEKRCFNALRDLSRRLNVPPTLQEIADELGITRPAAHYYLQILQSKGWVRRRHKMARTLEIVPRRERIAASAKRSA